eukprot:6642021-Pyramimonas_sp.AAC.3
MSRILPPGAWRVPGGERYQVVGIWGPQGGPGEGQGGGSRGEQMRCGAHTAWLLGSLRWKRAARVLSTPSSRAPVHITSPHTCECR